MDVILSVGYRTNSARAVEFRKWATKVLRGYISDGFAIDRKLAAKRYEQFMEAVEAVKKMLPATSSVDRSRITPPALTALTLLVAESDPKDKERIVRLVIALIQGFRK